MLFFVPRYAFGIPTHLGDSVVIIEDFVDPNAVLAVLKIPEAHNESMQSIAISQFLCLTSIQHSHGTSLTQYTLPLNRW